MVYFVLIYNWLSSRIDSFGSNLMSAVTSWMTATALVLVTIWIMIQGYRMITGQSRDSMMALVVNMVRVVVIVTIATTIGVLGPNLHTLVTHDLSADMNQLFTGDDSTLEESIDHNLTYTQLALSAIDTVQVAPGDTAAAGDKARAQAFALFGTASAPMAAAAMLLLYNISLALEIGLAPLFIMCLLFDQTKGLFQRWLMYSIGTLFSMGVLAFVASLVLKLTLKVAIGLWSADIINAFLDTNAEGFTSLSMEQGGVGLLMTLLVISAPPMAAMFFQGTLGNFTPYSAFGSGASARPGPQGQPPGSYGYMSSTPSKTTIGYGDAAQTSTGGGALNMGTRGTIVSARPQEATIPVRTQPTDRG